MSTPEQAALASALQRAFAEAGGPSLTEVAESGVGVSRQRISDWRAGRHVPSRFSDLEPVIAYLQVAAAGHDTMTEHSSDRVTTWPTDRWREVWREAVGVADAEPEPPPAPSAPAETPTPEPVDRRPLALAVVTLLVVLVAALAVAAYLLSAATM